MTTKLDKAIARLQAKDKAVAQLLIMRIIMNDIIGLDIKQLSGHKDLFRVRKGRVRVVYRQENTRTIIVLVDLRNDKTYKDL
jgi:mRNA-degrading endonuclease RelE of RelBE toxin-antitoxin system